MLKHPQCWIVWLTTSLIACYSGIAFAAEPRPKSTKSPQGVTSPSDGVLSVSTNAFRAAVQVEWERQYTQMTTIITNGGFLYKPKLEQMYKDPILAARGIGNDDRARALDPEAYWHPTDTHPLGMVLRRARALLEHLRTQPDWKGDAKVFHAELDRLKKLSAAATQETVKKSLFLEVCALRRKLVVTNPLLGFDAFVVANSGNENNCAGHFVRSGSRGIWVIRRFLTDLPVIDNLSAQFSIANGPSQGKMISTGSLRGLELSFDGTHLLFSWRSGGWRAGDPDPSGCWHLVEAKVDGSSAQQLTDGHFHDMDPCYLPNGRIAFVSYRRDPNKLGMHIRCISGHPSVWTLHSCAADGSDIVTMSYHDLPEYSPSVDHDGKIVFTRWDYYDKASHWTTGLWTTFPDGRDPRNHFGNYFYPHQTYDRTLPNGQGTGLGTPQFLQGIRAIRGEPGQYIATVSAVHGGELGSLILIDTKQPDDYGVGQIKRLTPELTFPESENGDMGFFLGQEIYGYCWPLSRDFYLVTHNQDICVLDRFGNREILVARTEVPGASAGLVTPIPLRPRPMPPVIPEQTFEGKRNSLPHAPATIRIMNIYDADYPLPTGTKIKWVRVIQFFPKHGSGAMGAAANADYGNANNVRMPLGVAPVEEDGSAYFYAPIHRDIYFQVLDENGMAVHSMRSATHVQAGEQLTCLGCHEPMHSAPKAGATPKAFNRPPSMLVTEVPTGAVPFNFHVLVKPAFERSCLPCHQKMATEGKKVKLRPLECSYAGWRDIAWCNTGPRSMGGGGCMGSRTIPMHYGAHASILGKTLLNPTHQEARKKGIILEEDFRRMVLWLDCNSAQFGSIHSKDHVERQLKGELVNPMVDFDPANPLGLEIPPGASPRNDDKASMLPIKSSSSP